MAGLYDLDPDAQVTDDIAIAWDDPDAFTGPATVTGTASVAGNGAVSAAGIQVASGTGTVAGNGAISATGLRVVLGDATVAGNGTIAADGNVVSGTPGGDQVATMGGATRPRVRIVPPPKKLRRLHTTGARITATTTVEATGRRTANGTSRLVCSTRSSATGSTFHVTAHLAAASRVESQHHRTAIALGAVGYGTTHRADGRRRATPRSDERELVAILAALRSN